MFYNSWIIRNRQDRRLIPRKLKVQKSYLINISANPLYYFQGRPYQLLVQPVLLPNLVRVHVRQVIVIWKLRVRVRFAIRNELGVRIILQGRPLTTTTPRSRHELRMGSIPTDNSHVLIELVAPDLNDLIINGNQPVLMTDQQTSGRRLSPIGNYRRPGPIRNLQLLFFNSDLRLVTPPLE